MKKVIKTQNVKPVAQPVARTAEKSHATQSPSKAPKLAAKVSEYNGHKILQLRRTADDKFPLSLGWAKLNLIVQHGAEVVDFVKKYAPSVKQTVAA